MDTFFILLRLIRFGYHKVIDTCLLYTSDNLQDPSKEAIDFSTSIDNQTGMLLLEKLEGFFFSFAGDVYKRQGLYHSQNIEGALTTLPGARIVCPSFADDAAGLLRDVYKRQVCT